MINILTELTRILTYKDNTTVYADMSLIISLEINRHVQNWSCIFDAIVICGKFKNYQIHLYMFVVGDHGTFGKNSRVTLHTTEPTCTQPSIVKHTIQQIAYKMAVRERIDSAPKQANFVHLCITRPIVVKAFFSVIVRHTMGKVNDCKE